MDVKVKSIINNLLTQQPTGVMLEGRNGKIFLLHDHHKHLCPEKDSIRILVGTGKLDKQYNYYSNKL